MVSSGRFQWATTIKTDAKSEVYASSQIGCESLIRHAGKKRFPGVGRERLDGKCRSSSMLRALHVDNSQTSQFSDACIPTNVSSFVTNFEPTYRHRLVLPAHQN